MTYLDERVLATHPGTAVKWREEWRGEERRVTVEDECESGCDQQMTINGPAQSARRVT